MSRQRPKMDFFPIVTMKLTQLMVNSILELSARILMLAKEHGRITISQLATLTGASRNTLKLHLRKLVKRKRLDRHGAGRSTWYTLAR